MKKITSFFIALTVSFGFAQQILIEDFDGAAPSFAGFEGLASASIEAAPAGSNGNSFKLVSQVAGNPWQGAEVIMQTYNINLTTDKTASIDVYSSQAFTLLAKVETGGPASAAAQSYTTPGSWQTLTFTFTQALDGTAAANGDYSKIVFFPNWKSDNSGFNNPPSAFTIYVDNITAEGTAIAADPEPTTAAPTPPARNPSDVVSFYSNAYTNNSDWGQIDVFAGTLTDVVVAGNDTYKLDAPPGGGFQYNFFASGLSADLSGMTHYHVDIWVANSVSGGEVFTAQALNYDMMDALESNNFYQATITTTGDWISVDVPLASWANAAGNTNYDRVKLLQIILQGPAYGPVYFDNLYFHNNTVLGTDDFEISGLKTYPNPTQNSWTVKTGGSKISAVEVFDILGKNVLSVSPDSQEAKIDGSQLSKGIYLAKISSESGSKTLRLIKN